MRSVFLFILLAFSLPTLGQLPTFSNNAKAEGECVPAQVTFKDLSEVPGTIVKRLWNFGDGSTAEFLQDEIETGHNYINAGKFHATLTLIMADGSELLSAKQPVFIWPKPVAAFEASELEGCPPLDVDLTDVSTSAEGAITKWIWDFDNKGSTLQNPSYSFSRTNDFPVSLIVFNEYGCKSDAPAKQIIKVFDPVVPSFTTNVNGSCNLPVEIKFTNTTKGKGNIEYKWNFDGLGTSTEKDPKYTFTTANA
jgi:PKD repeat protein